MASERKKVTSKLLLGAKLLLNFFIYPTREGGDFVLFITSPQSLIITFSYSLA